MVPAQALASLALCWQPQRHYGASTAFGGAAMGSMNLELGSRARQLARVPGVLQQLRSWSRFLSQSHHRDDQARLEGSKTHEPPAPRLLRGVVHGLLCPLRAATYSAAAPVIE